jgi:enoyl-CoA hydratase/carnithine racemase
MYKLKGADFTPEHFDWQVDGGVATITLNRPERKNPLTLDSYAELRDTFHNLRFVDDVKTVIFTGAGGNFCSGGDVHEIIGPLTKMDMPELLEFTRMTGSVISEMRNCPQPIITAQEGVCAGAGAIISMASDLRYAGESSTTAFLFNKVGLAGCDMGACTILPRIIGQGRASELLYLGRAMKSAEGLAWGYFNDVVPDGQALAKAQEIATRMTRDAPTFANSMTKKCLHQEWNVSIEQALEIEAEAQAICMQTKDFTRAYNAFVAKERPVFEGN